MKQGGQNKELSRPEGHQEDPSGAPASESGKDVSPEREISENSELLNGLPSDARKSFEIGMMSMHRFGPMPNPLAEKLNEKHIDKILELSAKSEEQSFKGRAQSRWFTLIYALLLAALFTFVTIFLVQADKDLYKEALKLFTVFIGGLGGGFGIKSYLDRNKET
uniref:Uncharacterized protein n=1 Tax=Candidatus Kentrum sp. MB TaxID=2138164 RepID=A0A451BC90_9GAMM|nr:MAG: hypothetical protein BECKMB1821I_GA0114274_103229 [Candidatus Kentron sp. MB]VFK75855.1 MAG: hypothetical protein BECKMB1821H_GA0114242_103329 [Candidatus Kentron sp. MB]